MFAIDSVGALASSFMLGAILPRFQPLIGMPTFVLWMLAAIALCFCAYSFWCYNWASLSDPKWLRGIIRGNSTYCLLTAVLLVVYWDQVTMLGRTYFISETLIIVGIVLTERRVFQKTYPV
ncbi:MAG: hypothetical protein KDD43_00325 [Bdellovibrionales bacterium]|nr:hypothetical protein [Bdellovibrionales bacterium]